MTRVLLTGGSGFIAAHVLDLLLKRGQVTPNMRTKRGHVLTTTTVIQS